METFVIQREFRLENLWSVMMFLQTFISSGMRNSNKLLILKLNLDLILKPSE